MGWTKRYCPGLRSIGRIKAHNTENITGSVAQSYLTLFDPLACSPPGSSVHGIFQTRILERVATSAPDKKELILLEVLLHPPPCGPALESLSGPQGSSQQLQVCSIPSTLRETRFGVTISKCSHLIRNSLSQKKKKLLLPEATTTQENITFDHTVNVPHEVPSLFLCARSVGRPPPVEQDSVL